MKVEQICTAISQAGATLLNPRTPHGLALRQSVAQRHGHHPDTIERGLRDTLSELDTSLKRLGVSRPKGAAVDSHALVLAGNVFTLALRPIVVSLIAGVHTRVKPATPGDPFAEFFWSALTQADPDVGKLIEVARFSSADEASFETFLSGAQSVSVYGHQESIESVGARLKDTQRLSGHGPGFGAIVLEESDLIDLIDVVEAAAHDIVAYDQAGCLSPHVIWFSGSMKHAHTLAESLNVALDERRDTVAHHMDTETAVEALRWRAAATADTLIGDRTHAIWLREGALFRPSPGHRHITIAVCDAKARQGAIDTASPLLKALATPTGELDAIEIKSDTPPRICVLGQMQSPALDHIWDGASLWKPLFP